MSVLNATRLARFLRPLVILVLIAAPATVSAKNFSAWSLAVPETAINDPGFPDGCPIEAPNGLSIYFASTRTPNTGNTGLNDIWMAERSSVDAPWSAPQALPEPVNSAAADFCPTPLTGKRLFFVSDRVISGVSCGAGDMYRTRNNPAHGWEAPINLGCSSTGAGPNSSGPEFSPSIVETSGGTLLFYSGPGAAGGQDIYVSVQRANGTFAPGTPVTELNTGSNDQMPNVSRDGLEIVFSSDRSGGIGGMDVYSSTRASTSDPWSAPVNLGSNVNTGASETRASLSGDGERLHFGRSGEIYVSERTKVTGN